MENENKKINHIAIAVPNLERAASKWEQALSMKKSEVVVLKEHGVKIVFLGIEGLIGFSLIFGSAITLHGKLP